MTGNPYNIGRKIEKYRQVEEYLNTPARERLPLPMFRREFKIRKSEFLMLKKEIEDKRATGNSDGMVQARKWIEESLYGVEKGVVGKKLVTGKEKTTVLRRDDDAEDWLEENYPALLRYTFESAKAGNASSQKLLAQLMGKLIEKSKVRVELSADDIVKRNLEAERQLKEGGYLIDSGK